ncbi:MAG: hypothetical protein ABW127_17155 [Candidatus Thiodiazotropha endolucinida]
MWIPAENHGADWNDWIDESDAIFSRLHVWSKDSAGMDQLVVLGSRGIGAIYLGHLTTPFSLKDDTNQSLGVVRSSVFYLNVIGTMGTLQQVDLVV